MEKFRPPYRIVTVMERLKKRTELINVSITIEELKPDREEGYFPKLQYDTCRVFVRRGEYSINVCGVIEDGKFHYRAHAYNGASPWDRGWTASIDQVETIIEYIIARFDELGSKLT